MNYELLMLNDAVVMVERGWTQQILARGAAGDPVPLEEADSFCAFGALLHAKRKLEKADYPEVTEAFSRITNGRFSAHAGIDNLIVWNDAPSRTQAEVVHAFRTLIQRMS